MNIYTVLSSWVFRSFLVVIFTVTGVHSNLQATHLIGGNMGYVYLGPDTLNPGNEIYEITLDSYMDCNSTSWGTFFPENSVNVGIYEGVLNPSSSLFNTIELTLFLADSNKVDPNLPPICNPFNLLGGVCVYLVRYEATVSLPTTTEGYWIVYDRCCRPGGIINLNNSGAQSFAYTTWVPADSTGFIINSSAQFTDTLLSYICRTDTAYISNSATDADGDSIVYTLVTPFKGLTGNGNGGNPPPQASYTSTWLNPYTIPPPNVNYAASYNLANLLGIGSYSSTNPSTGLTKFLTNNSGIFVAAVEITEYRNGQIMSVSRRNMQLISDNCPNNNMPNQDISVLDPSAISPLVYQVNAGDSVCFDLNYDDLDGDLLEFTATGDVFDISITNPPATSNSPIQGVGSVTGTICWNTSCAQGSSTPYLINVVVVDSNCPPLPLPQDVLIYVTPFQGLQNIFGDSVVCVTNTPSFFSTDVLSNVTYSWSVTGGTIVSGAGTTTIGIVWNNSQQFGTVSVTATNSLGCVIGPITKSVFLSDVIADAGPDVSFCDGDSIQIGGAPTTTNPINTIAWSPSNTLSSDTISNPFAHPTNDETYIVTLTNSFSCVGTDTVNVVVNFLQSSELLDEYYLCPGDSADPFAAGSSFAWSPNLFINDSTLFNPLVYPDTTSQYFLSYLDSNGCPGLDSAIFTVNSVVPTNAGIDTQICIGDSVILGGNPTSPPNTTFSWSPNSNISSLTDANPQVIPTNTTTYIVQTFNDTCTGADTVTVIVNPLPPLSVSNDTILCIGDSAQLMAIGDGAFLWSPNDSISNDSISNPLAFPNTATMFFVTLTDSIGCESIDSVYVDIQPLPIINAGGLINACKLQPIAIGGNPTGPTNASYIWSPANGIDTTTGPNPIFNLDQDMTYQVTVTDSLGCVNTGSVQVKVFQISGLPDTTLCEKQLYTLVTTLTNGVSPFTFSWTDPTTLSNPNSASPFIYTGNISSYNVTVTDANNCIDSTSFNISLLASTNSVFSHRTAISCNGISVQITNESSGAVEYEWSINGEVVSNEEEPDLVFPYGQDATLTLLTTSVDGCTDTAEVIIPSPTFEDAINIQASNVFTPNGDGENDYFSIKTAGDISDCAELKIYNRNGALVYESSGGIFSWDGFSVTGQEFPEGVYYYVYSVNGIEKHGNITLLK